MYNILTVQITTFVITKQVTSKINWYDRMYILRKKLAAMDSFHWVIIVK